MRRPKWLSAAETAAQRVDARTWLGTTIRAAGGEANALGAQLDPSLSQLLRPLIEAVRADPACLGDAYAAVTRAEGRPTGRYYTPAKVVTAILDRIPKEARVLDPACGGGRFLLGSDRIGVGYDLDPIAVALAQDLAALAGRTVRVEHRDALADFAADRLPWGTFDAVVGNPPYRGGRHRGLAQNTALYRRRFITAEYQLDPYILFIELSLKMLREGGHLALVIPNAWISNLRTNKLRAHLARYTLDAVAELPIDTFDASVETVVLHLRKVPSEGAKIPVEGPHGGHLYIPANPSDPWPLARTAQAEAILKAANRCTFTLGDVAEITRGINPYHHTTHTPAQIATRVHHSDRSQGPEWVPELRGRHLGAYRLWWSGAHWIHYGPWLKEPRARRFFEGPRLVVRKILGATLCAAYLDTPLCCDQSVYIARLTNSWWPPGVLLAILNSHFIAELFRTRHQEDDQAFPQIKVAELRWLPLPPVDPAGLTELGQDALKLQALEAERLVVLDAELGIEDPAERAAARSRMLRAGWTDPHTLLREDLRARIERAVARLYGLSPPLLERYSPGA